MNCRRIAPLAVVAAMAMLLGLVVPGAASAAAMTVVQPSDAAITPGVRMITAAPDGTRSACTATFVFSSAEAAYLGYAAHCAGSGRSMGLSGCTERSLPLGTEVQIEGNDGSLTTGTLAYSSWITMQRRGEVDAARCQLNDFALVELAPGDVESVDPTVPVLGGPADLDSDGTEPGELVYSYQPNNDNGTAVKQGESLGTSADGLTHNVVTSPPGRQGDSGSGYLDEDGSAFGVLSTLTIDDTSTNGVTDLAHALSYANQYGGIGTVSLVLGEESFDPRT